jgi:hypothetical protein
VSIHFTNLHFGLKVFGQRFFTAKQPRYVHMHKNAYENHGKTTYLHTCTKMHLKIMVNSKIQ